LERSPAGANNLASHSAASDAIPLELGPRTGIGANSGPRTCRIFTSTSRSYFPEASNSPAKTAGDLPAPRVRSEAPSSSAWDARAKSPQVHRQGRNESAPIFREAFGECKRRRHSFSSGSPAHVQVKRTGCSGRRRAELGRSDSNLYIARSAPESQSARTGGADANLTHYECEAQICFNLKMPCANIKLESPHPTKVSPAEVHSPHASEARSSPGTPRTTCVGADVQSPCSIDARSHLGSLRTRSLSAGGQPRARHLWVEVWEVRAPAMPVLTNKATALQAHGRTLGARVRQVRMQMRSPCLRRVLMQGWAKGRVGAEIRVHVLRGLGGRAGLCADLKVKCYCGPTAWGRHQGRRDLSRSLHPGGCGQPGGEGGESNLARDAVQAGQIAVQRSEQATDGGGRNGSGPLMDCLRASTDAERNRQDPTSAKPQATANVDSPGGGLSKDRLRVTAPAQRSGTGPAKENSRLAPYDGRSGDGMSKEETQTAAIAERKAVDVPKDGLKAPPRAERGGADADKNTPPAGLRGPFEINLFEDSEEVTAYSERSGAGLPREKPRPSAAAERTGPEAPKEKSRVTARGQWGGTDLSKKIAQPTAHDGRRRLDPSSEKLRPFAHVERSGSGASKDKPRDTGRAERRASDPSKVALQPTARAEWGGIHTPNDKPKEIAGAVRSRSDFSKETFRPTARVERSGSDASKYKPRHWLLRSPVGRSHQMKSSCHRPLVRIGVDRTF
jgi:hypothetical protein